MPEFIFLLRYFLEVCLPYDHTGRHFCQFPDCFEFLVHSMSCFLETAYMRNWKTGEYRLGGGVRFGSGYFGGEKVYVKIEPYQIKGILDSCE